MKCYSGDFAEESEYHKHKFHHTHQTALHGMFECIPHCTQTAQLVYTGEQNIIIIIPSSADNNCPQLRMNITQHSIHALYGVNLTKQSLQFKRMSLAKFAFSPFSIYSKLGDFTQYLYCPGSQERISCLICDLS